MKTIIIIAAILSLVACSDPNETKTKVMIDNHCTDASKEARADFILQCLNNANPKSDEEPEDWIRECQYMAEDTLCEQKRFEITYRCNGSSGCFWSESSRKIIGD